MGRPREHNEQTRKALLRAAEKLLGSEGSQALSMRRVAEEAGTSTRAVYSLFGSKRALALELYRDTFETLADRLEAAPETDQPERDLVDLGVKVFRGFSLEHPNLFRFVFERAALGFDEGPDAMELGTPALSSLRDKVRRLADAGLIGGRSVTETTFQFHALCQGLASIELRGWLSRYSDPQSVWRNAFEVFVYGLSRPDTQNSTGDSEQKAGRPVP